MDLFSTFVDLMSTNLDGENPQMLYVSPMNLGGRIAKRLNELGWSQVDLLERVPEMNAGTLSATILRDAKKSQFAGKIAKALDVRLEWLLSGEGPMRDSTHHQPDPSQIGTPIITWDKPEDLPEGEFVIVPRYDLHVAAGNGHVVYEEIEHEQGQAYRTNSIRSLGTKASNLMTVYAKGDSMEPSIYAGDALLVDRGQREVQDRNVYVLRYGHEIRVKRLYKRPDGGLRIVSDNTNGYQEEVITAAEMEHIEIIGRVVERSGRM